MKQIVIVGAGDLGREIVWLIEDINSITPHYLIVGFLDDDSKKKGTVISGYDVLGETCLLRNVYAKDDIYAVIAMQNCKNRRRIIESNINFEKWETIIHPKAVVAADVEIGRGTVVFPNVTISVGCHLGDYNLLYTNSSLSNDVISGKYSSIMSNVQVSDRVQIGEQVFLSSGCSVYPRVSIGDHSEIAVGSIITKDINEGGRVGMKSGIFDVFK